MTNEMPEEIWTDINGNATRTEFKGGTKYVRADKAVPDGWKLVPIEPTEEMLQDGYAMDCVPVDKLRRAYSAMIDAAQPPTKGA